MISIGAVLAVRDEAARIETVVGYLLDQEIDVAVIDHGSTDGTRDVLADFARDGAVSVTDLPYDGVFSLRRQMAAKVQVVTSMANDWLVHQDADEVLHGSADGQDLRTLIEEADQRAHDAVNFEEFVFVPAAGEEHYPGEYQSTMLRYYFFAPSEWRLVRAVRRHLFDDLAAHFGHRVTQAGVSHSAEQGVLRHYICLGSDDLREKYRTRRYADDEVAAGAHFNRLRLQREGCGLPMADRLELLPEADSHRFSRRRPVDQHFWEWDDDPATRASGLGVE